MNYYIDFDNTLYETAKLTKLLLETISKEICNYVEEDFCHVLNYAKENFNSTTDNIFSFSESMSKKYNVNPQIVLQSVNKVIDNGKDIVFEDAKRFLERLKDNGDQCFILTFLSNNNQEYQMKKILGSGLAKYFDGIILTTQYKFLLDIKYENGIFIDDDPRDLNGLFEQNPIKVIRIRKPNNKRSKIELENKEIEEYECFDDIKLSEV